MLSLFANTDSWCVTCNRARGTDMANKTFIVELDTAERTRLSDLVSKGKAPAKTILKAPILLKADEAEGGDACADEATCSALDTKVTMVSRARETRLRGARCRADAQAARNPPIAPIFDGEGQAQLTALACSEPPKGYARWTIRLLASAVVERKIVPAAHHNTIGRALKKINSNRT